MKWRWFEQAAFGAPIGGVLFSMEEASTHWSRKVAWRCFLCTTVSVFTLAQLHPRCIHTCIHPDSVMMCLSQSQTIWMEHTQYSASTILMVFCQSSLRWGLDHSRAAYLCSIGILSCTCPWFLCQLSSAAVGGVAGGRTVSCHSRVSLSSAMLSGSASCPSSSWCLWEVACWALCSTGCTSGFSR